MSEPLGAEYLPVAEMVREMPLPPHLEPENLYWTPDMPEPWREGEVSPQQRVCSLWTFNGDPGRGALHRVVEVTGDD